MFDMMNMLGKAKEIQARIKEAQESLDTLIETAESGAGMVKATVNGKKQLISLEIDPELLKTDEKEMLQDLIVAATNKALADIDAQIKNHLSKSTEGLLPNIPGMDFDNMFK